VFGAFKGRNGLLLVERHGAASEPQNFEVHPTNAGYRAWPRRSLLQRAPQERAPQVLLHKRPEHVAKDQRRRLALKLDEDVAEHTDQCAQLNVHRAAVLSSTHGHGSGQKVELIGSSLGR
jgi:hypothetical protein